MKSLENLDLELTKSIDVLKSSKFFQEIISGDSIKPIYIKYLEYAYHYVRLSSSFTPLAARRIDPKYIELRKWILEHSAEELGHETLAIDDLNILGCATNELVNSNAPVGVLAWVSFFHYKVSIDNPFCAFGVLYFLEGMAKELAPLLLPEIYKSLSESEKGAISFFKEHGDLDEDHHAEQRAILMSTNISLEDERAIVSTIKEAGAIKKFMLDSLIVDVGV